MTISMPHLNQQILCHALELVCSEALVLIPSIFHQQDLNHLKKPIHDFSLQWPPSIPLQHRKKKETAPFTISKRSLHHAQAGMKDSIPNVNPIKINCCDVKSFNWIETQEQDVLCVNVYINIVDLLRVSIAHRINADSPSRSQNIIKPFTSSRNSKITSPHENPTRAQLLLGLNIKYKKILITSIPLNLHDPKQIPFPYWNSFIKTWAQTLWIHHANSQKSN